MNKKLNVLSLDWDFFINADMYTRCNLFPDCPNEGYPDQLKEIIWLSRYQSLELEKIDVRKDCIKEIHALMCNAFFNPISVLVADSHKHCYDFVCQVYDTIGFSGINLTNVDFHHDMYLNGQDVDCGNWLYKLYRKYDDKIDITWIHHPDSDTTFEHLDEGKIQLTTDIKKIHSYNWDIVFICRSSMWSPPHLDNDFVDLFKPMTLNYNSSFEPGIFESRFGATFATAISRERQMLQQILKG